MENKEVYNKIKNKKKKTKRSTKIIYKVWQRLRMELLNTNNVWR